MDIMKIIICLVIGYFFGNISISYLIGKANNVDIRDHGSGNAGATNVLRVVGKREAILAFLGDAIKAVLAIWLVKYLLYPADDIIVILSLITGIGVIIGHNYPFWLEGKGGKGIASTGGVMFAFDWRIALIAILIFAMVILVTKYVSLASLTLIFILPIYLIISYPGQLHIHLLGWVFVVFAFYRHKDNIKRLINGNERKINEKSS